MLEHLPEKNPLNWSLAMWLLPIGAGIFGGLVSVINKVAKKEITRLNSIESMAEITASGFVSLASFMLLNSFEFDLGVCASISGILSHQAMRWLFKVEKIIDKQLDDVESAESKFEILDKFK